jgi:hypothetical protein
MGTNVDFESLFTITNSLVYPVATFGVSKSRFDFKLLSDLKDYNSRRHPYFFTVRSRALVTPALQLLKSNSVAGRPVHCARFHGFASPPHISRPKQEVICCLGYFSVRVGYLRRCSQFGHCIQPICQEIHSPADARNRSLSGVHQTRHNQDCRWVSPSILCSICYSC